MDPSKEAEDLYSAIIDIVARLFGADKETPGDVLQVAMAHIVVGVMQMRLSAPDNNAATIRAGLQTGADMADMLLAKMDAGGPPPGLAVSDMAERLIARAANQISAEKGVASAVFRMTRKK